MWTSMYENNLKSGGNGTELHGKTVTACYVESGSTFCLI